MQVDFDSIQPETIEHFKGGEGSVTAQAYVDGNNRIMRATVHPHSSIGWHQHSGNSEIVYVMSGVGKVVVEGGEEPLAPGICHYCAEGQFHSVVNPNEEDLVVFAVVPQHGSLASDAIWNALLICDIRALPSKARLTR